MAEDLMRTPVVEVQWCKLLGEPRINKFEPKKAPTWSIEIVLENNNPEHMAWVEEIENKFDELHPGKKKHAHWCPVKPHKDEPRKKMTCRFKLPQFTFKDGNTSEGPTVFDKDGNRWDESQLIGNGSKMLLGYDIYAWGADSATGAGLTLQCRAAQVKEWLAAPKSVRVTATDFGFDSSKAADEAVKAAAEAKEEPVAVTVTETEAADGIPF